MLLKYEIGVVGEKSVDRALGSIERRISQHNARVTRIVGPQAARASRAGGSSTLADARREGVALQREQERQLRYWRNAQVQAIRQRDREAAQAHRQEIRRQGEQKRAAESLDRQRSRALFSHHQRQERMAERSARTAMRDRERMTRGTFGFAGKSVGGTLQTVGALGGTALGLAGGFAAAGAIRAQMDERAAASRLANQAGDPSLKGTLVKEAQGVRGFTGSEALAGMEAFVTKTGDLDTARAIIGDLGSLALATGSDLGDLGATAGQAFNVLKDQIDDPVQRVKELNALMRTLAVQGSLGAVEIRDLAQDFGKLGAATRSFEGGAPELLRTMGAFAQIAVARGGAESSADASTAAARLAADIVEPAKRKRFAALGVDIKSEKDPTKLRDPLAIMLDVLEKTGGDVEKTSGLFGIESGKIFKGLGATFSEAEKRKKGSGRQAVTAEFERFAGARMSEAEVKAKEASRLEDPDLLIKEGVKNFNTKVGTALIPTIIKLTDTMGKLVPYAERVAVIFAGLVDSFIDDPLAGIGKIIAAKLVADIAAAGLSNVLKGAITSAVMGAPLPTGDVIAPGGTGGGKPGGKPIVGGATAGAMLGAAGTGLQLGLATATIIVTSGVINFEKGEADIKTAGSKVDEARELAAKGDADAVRQKRLEVQEMVDKRNRMTMTDSIVSGALDVAQYAGPLGWALKATGAVDPDKAAKSITGATIDQNRDVEIKSLEGALKQIESLELAAAKAAGALAKLDTGALNRGPNPSPVKN